MFVFKTVSFSAAQIGLLLLARMSSHLLPSVCFRTMFPTPGTENLTTPSSFYIGSSILNYLNIPCTVRTWVSFPESLKVRSGVLSYGSLNYFSYQAILLWVLPMNELFF